MSLLNQFGGVRLRPCHGRHGLDGTFAAKLYLLLPPLTFINRMLSHESGKELENAPSTLASKPSLIRCSCSEINCPSWVLGAAELSWAKREKHLRRGSKTTALEELRRSAQEQPAISRNELCLAR